MLRQGLCKQTWLGDELLQIQVHHETLQRLNGELLDLGAVARGKHQRPAFQSSAGSQYRDRTRVVRRKVTWIGAGHAHPNRWIPEVENFERNDLMTEVHWS